MYFVFDSCVCYEVIMFIALQQHYGKPVTAVQVKPQDRSASYLHLATSEMRCQSRGRGIL